MDQFVIQKMCQSLLHSSHGLENLFVKEGKDLAWVMFGIAIGHHLWKTLIDDHDNPLARIMRTILITSVLFFFLVHWQSVVVDFFSNKINLLANKISPQSQDQTLSRFFEILHAISEKSFLSPVSLSPGQIVVSTLGNLSAFFLKTATEIIIIVTMTAYLIILYMGSVVLSISLMLGPLLCPWTILTPTRFLFDGWLKFTIATSLYQIVGSAMSLICRVSIESLEKMAHKSLIPHIISPDQTILIFIMMICLIFLTLFWQIPEICRSIVSGAGSVSSTHIRQSLDFSRVRQSHFSLPSQEEAQAEPLKKSLRRENK